MIRSFPDAPVMNLIGHGFRPAYQPADYIGPRMDCPMWMPTPDADCPYGPGKYDLVGGNLCELLAFTLDRPLGGSIGDITNQPALVPLPASGLLLGFVLVAACAWKVAANFFGDHPGSGWVGHDSAMPKGGY